VADLARAAGVSLNIKAIRHYTASQMLAKGFELGNTAARLGHSGGGSTTLKHYADSVSEVDRRAAVRLARPGQRGVAGRGGWSACRRVSWPEQDGATAGLARVTAAGPGLNLVTMASEGVRQLTVARRCG
jgi:hypothetical protein